MTVGPALSARALKTPPSPIRKLAHLAQAARSEGAHIYHLNIGQPDIVTPLEFWNGLDEYPRKVLAYEQSEGSASLRKAVAQYLNRSLALSIAEEQVLITTGASEALVMLFMVCGDPGDEALIFDPTYANYIGFAAVSGVNLVPVPGEFEENYALPEDDKIRSFLTKKTKAILLCNPNNPTGRRYNAQELKRLLALADEYNLFLILDETYREFVYDGEQPLSIFQLAPNNPRVVVVDSLSKRFSLCGARIGYVASTNAALHAALFNIAQARLASPTIEQFASASMLTTIPPTFIGAVRDEYQRRRNALVTALRQIPGVEAPLPQGAFYLLAKLPVADCEAFARFLLEKFRDRKESVFIAPAEGFFMQAGRGKDKARIAYVLEVPALLRAVEILGKGLEAYQKIA